MLGRVRIGVEPNVSVTLLKAGICPMFSLYSLSLCSRFI